MSSDPSSAPGVSRREFLERTAMAAGAAGAVGIPTELLVAQAAKAAAKDLPAPRNVPIDHFVLLMMENRSFDHYFGWASGQADGVLNQRFPDPTGKLVRTRPAASLGTGGVQFKGCGHPDPGHGWNSGRAQLLGGFMAEGSGNDEFALSYYRRGELGFIHEAARQYTLYDRYFCSILAGTWPNRYYKWSGPVRRGDEQQHRAGRQQLGDHLRPRHGPRPDRALLLLGPALRGALGGPLHPLAGSHLAVLHGLPRPASCRTSPSWTRRSRTGAGATDSPRTSIRSATCGWVRRSRRTW